jgi:hypothetical protein
VTETGVSVAYTVLACDAGVSILSVPIQTALVCGSLPPWLGGSLTRPAPGQSLCAQHLKTGLIQVNSRTHVLILTRGFRGPMYH